MKNIMQDYETERVYGNVVNTWKREDGEIYYLEVAYKDYYKNSKELAATGTEDFTPERYKKVVRRLKSFKPRYYKMIEFRDDYDMKRKVAADEIISFEIKNKYTGGFRCFENFATASDLDELREIIENESFNEYQFEAEFELWGTAYIEEIEDYQNFKIDVRDLFKIETRDIEPLMI